MSKKYSYINLTVDEFYSYIGTPIVYNKKLTVLYSYSFDVDIKGIKNCLHNGTYKKFFLPPVVFDLMNINHTFVKSLIKDIADHFTLYFSTEEDALYFKMKYCTEKKAGHG